MWLNRPWRGDKLRLAVNANVPDGICVSRVRPCSPSFDARRDAQWRLYRYCVWLASWCPPQIEPWVWWNKVSHWDMDLFAAGCRLLEGRHDFSAFCRQSEVPENPWRRLYSVRFRRRGPLVVVAVCGDAFLTNMVRIMMGNLDDVSRGKRSLDWLAGLLEGGRRSSSAMTAPPSGLTLWRVGYRPKARYNQLSSRLGKEEGHVFIR